MLPSFNARIIIQLHRYEVNQFSMLFSSVFQRVFRVLRAAAETGKNGELPA
jgi:hypothetical protein